MDDPGEAKQDAIRHLSLSEEKGDDEGAGQQAQG